MSFAAKRFMRLSVVENAPQFPKQDKFFVLSNYAILMHREHNFEV